MASSCFSMTTPIFKIRFFLFLCFIGISSSQLSSDFYSTTCPNALSTIKSAVDSAVSNEARMGASLLRLHFHDCFVQASQLTQLHPSSYAHFTSSTITIIKHHQDLHDPNTILPPSITSKLTSIPQATAIPTTLSCNPNNTPRQ